MMNTPTLEPECDTAEVEVALSYAIMLPGFPARYFQRMCLLVLPVYTSNPALAKKFTNEMAATLYARYSDLRLPDETYTVVPISRDVFPKA